MSLVTCDQDSEIPEITIQFIDSFMKILFRLPSIALKWKHQKMSVVLVD